MQPTETLIPATMSGFDDVGTVFLTEGRVMRGIRTEKVEETKVLLESGLIRKLEDDGLFPPTELSRHCLPGYGMTLEHERLHPLVLPSEWTPGMFRQAALSLLEINRIARSFGFETKDGHLYNFSFVGTRPMFFDLGSFVRVHQENLGWRARDEFVRSALYPLIICRHKAVFLNQLLFDFIGEHSLTYEDYIRLRCGLLATYIPCRMLARGRSLYERFRALGSEPDERIDRIDRPQFMRQSFKFLRRKGLLKYMTSDLSRLRSRIRRISPPLADTQWSNYQRHLFDKSGDLVLEPRYERICELLDALKPTSIVELGANVGAFCLALRVRGVARQVVSTDSDVGAVEHAFEMFKRRVPDCTTAVVDFLKESGSIRVPSVADRYRAHTVVALALSHHLILARGMEINLFMRRLASFCTHNVIVEFMPSGLWDGKFAPPVPSWYSLEWFRSHFIEQFELMHEEQLELNRVVLLGRKRYKNQSTSAREEDNSNWLEQSGEVGDDRESPSIQSLRH